MSIQNEYKQKISKMSPEDIKAEAGEILSIIANCTETANKAQARLDDANSNLEHYKDIYALLKETLANKTSESQKLSKPSFTKQLIEEEPEILQFER